MMTTAEQYNAVLAKCKEVFEKKNKDYGTSWRILRLPSLTDQIYIKAKRIRSIQEKGQQKVDTLGDDINSEFIGIINYCIMALINLEKGSDGATIELEELLSLYDKMAFATRDLLTDKNHDYDEAWRSMRVSSMTDIILMKLIRTKQIEDNAGKTLISEGVEANYQDMINYSVFCFILLNEEVLG